MIRALEVRIVLLNIIHTNTTVKKKQKKQRGIIAVCSFPSSLWVLNGPACPLAVWWAG